MKTFTYPLKELIEAWHDDYVMLSNGKLHKPSILTREWGRQREDLRLEIQKYANLINNFKF